MKCAIIFCVLSVAALTLARPEEKYTDRYDNVDLDEILSNPKIFENYANCILDKGKCPPDGKELKEHIREALENKCGKCTDAQKDGTRKVIKELINKHKQLWNEAVAKYDPERKYSTKYETELREVSA